MNSPFTAIGKSAAKRRVLVHLDVTSACGPFHSSSSKSPITRCLAHEGQVSAGLPEPRE